MLFSILLITFSFIIGIGTYSISLNIDGFNLALVLWLIGVYILTGLGVIMLYVLKSSIVTRRLIEKQNKNIIDNTYVLDKVSKMDKTIEAISYTFVLSTITLVVIAKLDRTIRRVK